MKPEKFENKDGCIAIWKNGTYAIFNSCRNWVYSCPAKFIEKSLNWKKIVEKDYEILKARHKVHSCVWSVKDWSIYNQDWEIYSVKRLSDGLVVSLKDEVENKIYPRVKGRVYDIKEEKGFIYVYYTKNKGCDLLEYIQKSRKPEKDYGILHSIYQSAGRIEIRSVIRLSDGEVFSVGDDIQYKEIKECSGKITKFTEIKSWVLVEFSQTTELNSIRLNDIQKPKRQPILTTEDGVELYYGEEHHWIDKSNLSHIGIDRTDDGDPQDDILYFSTREAAEAYRLDKARMLSIYDIDKVCEKFDIDVFNTIGKVCDELERIVKSRLK